MIAWTAVAAALLLGWGAWRRLAGNAPAPGPLPGSVLLAALGTSAWLAILDLAGAPWSPVLLLLPSVIAAIAGATAPPPPRSETAEHRWLLIALAAVAPRALTTALNPAFGWDFRYQWGLKARAFAAVGSHDGGWLAQPAHEFTNPTYPPLWSDLMAAGVRLGAGVEEVAAAWQAVLVLALAAACWEAAGAAPARVRALAATAGGWAPVILWPGYSGYAEPLLAFLTAVALGLLVRTGSVRTTSAVWLSAGTAALALAKNEGVALAAGIVLGVAADRGVRRALAPALALVAAVVAWQGFLHASGIAWGPAFAGLDRVGAHLVGLPEALAAAFKPKYAVIVLAWLLVVPALRGRALRGARVVLATWAAAVALAYLATPYDLRWHLFTSLDRVLAAPLPAALALGLAASLTPAPAATRGAAAPAGGESPSFDRDDLGEPHGHGAGRGNAA